jgi:hypothetical protein
MFKNTIIKTDDVINYFTSYINQDKPLFFSRVGGSDANIVDYYYNNKNLINDKSWYESSIDIVKMYNGYFDFANNKNNFQKYLEDMIVYYKNSDDCFFMSTHWINENDMFLQYIYENKTIIAYHFIESIKPFIKSFSDWAKNKKILIISPLSKSIEYQFKNKDKLYIDYKFPEFELKTYNTKITYNSVNDTKENLGLDTNNYFEECERMAEEISKIDFDIALLSCASYGMFLGNYIKYNMNKKAIYFGGVLNVLFNIYGGRYSDDYYKSAGLNLEYQIDSFENNEIEHIKGGKDKPSEGLNAYFGRRKK